MVAETAAETRRIAEGDEKDTAYLLSNIETPLLAAIARLRQEGPSSRLLNTFMPQKPLQVVASLTSLPGGPYPTERLNCQSNSVERKKSGEQYVDITTKIGATMNPNAPLGPKDSFPIVCIGGSTGGQEAFSRLFDCLPGDTGCAFVVINHVRSAKLSLLPEILATHTKMRVMEIGNAMTVEPNTVFVIPPRCDVRVRGNQFELDDVGKPSGWPNVITIFLESLADQWPVSSVAVIMSGLDSDGVAALKDIKRTGGIAIAQAPDSAAADDMPLNAINSGEVDYVLPPEEIGSLLSRICRNSPQTKRLTEAHSAQKII